MSAPVMCSMDGCEHEACWSVYAAYDVASSPVHVHEFTERATVSDG